MSLPKGKNAFVAMIHEHYHKLLYFYAISLCNGFNRGYFDADDIMQEFYLIVIHRENRVIAGFEKSGIAYLFTIIKNLFIDQQRKLDSLNRVEEIFSKQVPLENSIYYLAPDEYSRTFYNQLKKLLSPKDSEVFILFLEGWKYAQISEELDININTVGVIIFRAKKLIKRHLTDLNDSNSSIKNEITGPAKN